MLKLARKMMLATSLLFVAVGCQHIPRAGLVVKPSPAEIKLQQLADEREMRVKELEAQIESFRASFQAEFDANISLGSASVMAAYETLIADDFKTRYTLAAIPSLEVAMAALPQPTIEDYKLAIQTQRKLLSEQAKEIEEGKKQIEEQKARAAASKEAQEKALAEKAALEQEKKEAEEAFQKEKEILQEQAVQEVKEIAAAKQKEIDDAKAADRAKLQRIIIYILMGVGVVAGILSLLIKGPGSLFNPVFALASGAAIGLAISVSFLPLWITGTAIGVLFLAIVISGMRELHRYRRIAKASVGALQEHKNENTADFKEKIAPKMRDWTEGNKGTEQDIDKLAEELNVKSKNKPTK